MENIKILIPTVNFISIYDSEIKFKLPKDVKLFSGNIKNIKFELSMLNRIVGHTGMYRNPKDYDTVICLNNFHFYSSGYGEILTNLNFIEILKTADLYIELYLG